MDHQAPFHGRWFPWLGWVAIVLLTFAAYSSAIRGGFIWDDDAYLTNNPLLTSPHGLWQIWTTTKSPQYYPLVFTTFWVERHLWGLNSTGYHAVNVSLHVMNALLVWWLLRRLEVPGAWMIGAIFAVHPVHVESVAWITERKNVLSGLLYLLAVGSYLRFETERRWSWYAGALGLFILALLSKTVVATLPVALLLIRYLRGWRIGRREVLELVPFLVLGAAMGLLTMWYEVHRVGAQGPEWNLSMGERLLVAGRALVFYVTKLLWPTNLTFSYPRWELNILDPLQWSWVLGAGIAGLLFWWKRHVWGRGPLVGLAFFSVSLAPALGFFDVYPMRYSFVADHFQYLASLGIIAPLVGNVAWGFNRWRKSDSHGNGRLSAWMKPVPGLSVLVILAALTWEQGQVYEDRKTLWQDTVNKNPGSWLAHNGLGVIYAREGRQEEAIREYLTTLRLQPNSADAHFNLGNAYNRQGRQEEAIQEYLTTLRLQPDHMDAHINLGNAYSKQGRQEEAIQEYLTTLRLQPDHINAYVAHINLGNAYADTGRLEEATREYLAAVQLKPDSLEARYNLGHTYQLKGLKAEARAQFDIVLRLRPDFIPAQKGLESLGF